MPHLPSWQGGDHEHHQPQLVLDDAAYTWCSKCIQNLYSVLLLTYRESLSIFESVSKQVTITCYPMKVMKCSSTWTKSYLWRYFKHCMARCESCCKCKRAFATRPPPPAPSSIWGFFLGQLGLLGRFSCNTRECSVGSPHLSI